MEHKQISFSPAYTSVITNTTCTCTKRQFTEMQLAVIMIGSIFGLIIVCLIAVIILKIFLKNFEQFAAYKWKLVTCKEHEHCKVGYHESLASKLKYCGPCQSKRSKSSRRQKPKLSENDLAHLNFYLIWCHQVWVTKWRLKERSIWFGCECCNPFYNILNFILASAGI